MSLVTRRECGTVLLPPCFAVCSLEPKQKRVEGDVQAPAENGMVCFTCKLDVGRGVRIMCSEATFSYFSMCRKPTDSHDMLGPSPSTLVTLVVDSWYSIECEEESRLTV